MKKFGCLKALLIFLGVCVVCIGLTILIVGPSIKSLSEDLVVKGIGKYEAEKYYSKEFEDYTCYRKFIFESINSENLEQSLYLSKVDKDAVDVLKGYEANFSRWIEKNGVEGYAFDMSIVSENDYYYIQSVADPAETEGSMRQFIRYKVYVLDSETKVMHHFQYERELGE